MSYLMKFKPFASHTLCRWSDGIPIMSPLMSGKFGVVTELSEHERTPAVFSNPIFYEAVRYCIGHANARIVKAILCRLHASLAWSDPPATLTGAGRTIASRFLRELGRKLPQYGDRS